MFDEIRGKMHSLRSQLEAKATQCRQLEEKLEQAEEARRDAERRHARELKQRLHEQQTAAEAQLQRNLEFIDRYVRNQVRLCHSRGVAITCLFRECAELTYKFVGTLQVDQGQGRAERALRVAGGRYEAAGGANGQESR